MSIPSCNGALGTCLEVKAGACGLNWQMVATTGAERERLAHGRETSWDGIRRLEILSGVARVELSGPGLGCSAKTYAARHNWHVMAPTTTEPTATTEPLFSHE